MSGKRTRIKGELPPKLICRSEAYQDFIKKDRSKVKGYIKDKDRYSILIHSFFKKVGHYLVESDNGVFIEGLGYFGICMDPSNPIVFQANKKQYTNFKTNFRTYTIVFIPISKDNGMLNWKMDYCFSRRIKQNLKEKILSGKKYKFIPEFFINQYSK